MAGRRLRHQGSGSRARAVGAGAGPRPQVSTQQLRERISNRLYNDPLFQVMTIDTLNWIDPFSGKIFATPFNFQEVALQYLMEAKPWREHKLKTMDDLNVIRWMHFLKKNIRTEPRLRMFHAPTSWLNPFTGEWAEQVRRTPDGKVNDQTINDMAVYLSHVPEAQRAQMIERHVLEDIYLARINKERQETTGTVSVDNSAAANDRNVMTQPLPKAPPARPPASKTPRPERPAAAQPDQKPTAPEGGDVFDLPDWLDGQ